MNKNTLLNAFFYEIMHNMHFMPFLHNCMRKHTFIYYCVKKCIKQHLKISISIMILTPGKQSTNVLGSFPRLHEVTVTAASEILVIPGKSVAGRAPTKSAGKSEPAQLKGCSVTRGAWLHAAAPGMPQPAIVNKSNNSDHRY